MSMRRIDKVLAMLAALAVATCAAAPLQAQDYPNRGVAIIVPSQSAVLGMGVDALILSFIVVVVGGLGSLEGALLGAVIVGFVREAGIAWFPEIELAVLYLIAAVVLLIRPAGLFGRA